VGVRGCGAVSHDGRRPLICNTAHALDEPHCHTHPGGQHSYFLSVPSDVYAADDDSAFMPCLPCPAAVSARGSSFRCTEPHRWTGSSHDGRTPMRIEWGDALRCQSRSPDGRWPCNTLHRPGEMHGCDTGLVRDASTRKELRIVWA
jgi:hypothetical protein